MNKEIAAYNAALESERQKICELLSQEISSCLPGAKDRVWHGAPVWFIDENPVVGYWNRKDHVQLLFWSGQTFNEPRLKPEGSFKAAEAHYADVSQVNTADLRRWLEKSRNIQWDYKNIIKRKGVLKRLK